MDLLIYTISYFATIIFGHLFVRLLLHRHRRDFRGGLKGAGTIIGILERIFVLTFVLLGEYTALVLIFTAKSIARFEELKDREFAEYYLIGTLLSILFAMLIGILASQYLK
ncbi:hypothetical protein CEE37_05165 [candidate division LCP-89 bacterium B3_LCP]|uniref:DUF3307 domain-containing protein n=1 Tax=candidate division LCP-89 bacterium B3_LCP TaxID=2012998 RepID=A0A532V232_UNCL8|nr:MAG: hypothetical protein CEE37_05165 [candidate division LCP-89 bacterium B3_LCP]